MINYFNEEELRKNNLKRVEDEHHPTIWYIYEEKRDTPIRVIKEILFEHVQLYRQIQYENNPNIVKILDIARVEDKFILEMEYVQGYSIGEFIEDVWSGRRNSTVQECLGIVLQICNGLKTCHKLGFVHRDISENNIILSRENDAWKAVLIDFGNCHEIKPQAAKDTTAIGTIGYAAPEQLGFSASDASTDIYAVGILMCRLLTGTEREGVEQIGNDRLRNIIKRCIRMEKTERYREIHVLMSDLRKMQKTFGDQEKEEKDSLFVSLCKYLDEKFHADYSNIFLETPKSFETPVYAVLMISLIIGIVLDCLTPFSVILCYVPYSFVISIYFKIRLEKTRFFYPFNQNFEEIQSNFNMILTMNQVRFQYINEYKMEIVIKKREYLVELDAKNQVIRISADWRSTLPGLRLLLPMIEDFGKIAYWFQHVQAW